MNAITSPNIYKAVDHLKRDGVIAYPTEGLYGLGCNPYSQSAVMRLLEIKRRPVRRGLIIVASDFSQVRSLITPLPSYAKAQVMETWPGPITWLFPTSTNTPPWIIGDHHTIAIRISNHPIIKALCSVYEGPLVSTSANITGYSPIRDLRSIQICFADKVDYIVQGKIGDLKGATPIRDALTGETVR